MNQEPIKALIMARFDKFMVEKDTVRQANGHTKLTNGDVKHETPETKHESSTPPSRKSVKREVTDDDAELSDAPASPSPKKRRKVADMDDDAAFAARLQAEENSRARPTRGGVNKKAIPAKKKKRTPKKKDSEKIKPEDDSDLEGSGDEAVEKKVNRSGGFHVRITLLATILVLLTP